MGRLVVKINDESDAKVSAKKLIDIASKAGADIIKFQTFKANSLLLKNAAKANYQKKSTNSNEKQYTMLKNLELNYQDHLNLINYCKKKKIEFLSSPFDIDSIKMIINLKLKRIKIPSSEMNNLPYLKAISKFKGKIILSTGMSNLNEIRTSINKMISYGFNKKNLTIMHCNSEYPTPFKDVNLKAMLTLKKIFNTNIGYSDHTLGVAVPIAAVAMGADVIEKHITLNKKMKGPDHSASLTPDELNLMVNSIRNIETSLGSSKKFVSKSELKNKSVTRKSIVALKKIYKNDIFSEKNLTVKRPGKGLSPMKFFNLIGKKSKKKYDKDDLISFEEL